MAERLGGVRLSDGETALAAALVRAGIAAIEQRHGQVPAAAFRLRDELVMFARRTSAAQAGPDREHANMPSEPEASGSELPVTVAEAAARSGYSPQHVRRLCASGVLVSDRAPGGAWMVEEWSLAVLAARRKEHDD